MTPAQFDQILKLFIAWVKQEFQYDLYRYQVRIARAVLHTLFVEPKDVYIKISRQAGKCLAKGTSVLMFDGSIKPVEKIAAGDLLMGDDSTPRSVLSIARGRERLWRVQPNSKGHEPYVVNESHILTVACRRTGRLIDRPLRSIKSLKQIDSCVLGVKAPVHFPSRSVPVEPYWLGLWLGDGSSYDVGITTADPEVVEYLDDYAARLGMKLSMYPEKNASDTYAITNGQSGGPNSAVTNPLRDALWDLAIIGHKRIPHAYRANSEAVRLELLAGLIDSDGHKPLAKGKENVCEFVFLSKHLAQDIQWLARSLGFRASICPKPVKGVTYWRVMLYGELWRIPTRIPRKRYTEGTLRENPRSYGFTLVDEGVGDYYGFEIDGNKRFLLGDCTVTHNTESVTLLLRFLIIFYRLVTGNPLMCGVASPKGEQAKTDIDRVKKSVALMRDRWHVEDREFNAATVRAYRFDKLHAEIFKFSLAPTTSNESKTLNLLIVEEAHNADDQKRSNELDPMLASTGGITVHIGVGCTRMCDFKRGCDGQMPGSEAIVVPVDEVIADRRAKFEETKDPTHLNYEKAYERELRKKGPENPQIRLNYLLDDIVELGNFISRERLIAHSRLWLPCADKLFLGLDWARSSDHTWATLTNDANDVVTWWKYPHAPYEEQIELMMRDLKRMGVVNKIQAVKGDATGLGDFPMEYLATHTVLPVDDDSKFKFTLQSKNDLYLNFQAALFRDPEDELAFSYPLNHALTPAFEEQMTRLEREYKGDGELLSVHHPDEPDARDDSCDSTALSLMAASGGGLGEIFVM